MAENKTVLVVDDEPLVLDLVGRILDQAGYGVLKAADGPTALELCAKDRIDLLVTDVHMPKMGGRELARCLSSAHPGIPILFMTGFDQETPAKRTLTSEPGLDGHLLLRKPFRPMHLLNAVNQLLD